MKYYLYSKFISPEKVMEDLKLKAKNRHPAITAIAVFKKATGIHFSLAEFADKYLAGGSRSERWFLANPEAKRKLFVEYMSLNQEREDWNNFGIISKDGTMYEPIDFMKHVEATNNSFKKEVPNDDNGSTQQHGA